MRSRAEKLDTMRAFGADLEIVPSDGGKVTPALFDRVQGAHRGADEEPNTFWTDQFNNVDALDGYAKIGRELVEQVGRVDAFCGAVGTAGMLVGVSRALKHAGSQGAHRRAGAVDLAVPDDRQGGAASRGGTAAGSPPHLTEGHLRRGARDRRRGGARDGAARSPAKKASSRARQPD